MAVRGSLVLRRLKKAIEKVRFLVSTNLSHWLYVGSAASATRRLSFKDCPGLLEIISEADSDDYHDASSSLGLSRTGSPAPGILSRTISSQWAEISRSPSSSASASASRTSSDASPSSGDDVDKRADAFIANFWRHIQMERQVSLELPYCKSNSLERTASD